MALDEAACSSATTITYLFLPLAHSFALLIQLGSFDLGGDDRLLGARPAEDHPEPGRGEADLLPVGAADLREDLHGRDRRRSRRPAASRSAIFNWAIGVGKKVRETRAQPASRPASCCASSTRSPTSRCSRRSAACSAARSAAAVTGAAPINPEILRFFDAAGVLVLEGWGMTETSTAATIATARRLQVRHGRQAVPRLRGEDRRRRRDPGQGPEHLPGLLQERGGDRARRSSTAGCTPATSARSTRTATSRSPAARRTSSSPRAARTSPRPTSRPRSSSTRCVSQCVVVGDRRPYLVALVTLDPEEARRSPRSTGCPTTRPSCAATPTMRAVDPGPRRQGQREVRPGRAGEEVRDPAPRPLPGDAAS